MVRCFLPENGRRAGFRNVVFVLIYMLHDGKVPKKNPVPVLYTLN